MNELKELNQT